MGVGRSRRFRQAADGVAMLAEKELDGTVTVPPLFGKE